MSTSVRERLVPFTKAHLQVLKSVTDEREHLKKIHSIVQTIYTETLYAAKHYSGTKYMYKIPTFTTNKVNGRSVTSLSQHTFIIKNMPDILAVLQELFPDSSVSHAILTSDADGRLYDISTLDDKMLPYVNRALDESYIIIDWS